jgi:hypothetical protein
LFRSKATAVKQQGLKAAFYAHFAFAGWLCFKNGDIADANRKPNLN